MRGWAVFRPPLTAAATTLRLDFELEPLRLRLPLDHGHARVRAERHALNMASMRLERAAQAEQFLGVVPSKIARYRVDHDCPIDAMNELDPIGGQERLKRVMTAGHDHDVRSPPMECRCSGAVVLP